MILLALVVAVVSLVLVGFRLIDVVLGTGRWSWTPLAFLVVSLLVLGSHA